MRGSCGWIGGSGVGGIPLVNRPAEGHAMGRSGFVGMPIDPELGLQVPRRIRRVTVDRYSDSMTVRDDVGPDDVMDGPVAGPDRVPPLEIEVKRRSDEQCVAQRKRMEQVAMEAAGV